MNDWLEKIEECMVDRTVILKVSFDLAANFSFIEHLAHQAMNEHKSLNQWCQTRLIFVWKDD